MMLSIQDVLKLSQKPTKHSAQFMLNGEVREFEFFTKEMKVADTISFREFYQQLEAKQPPAENLIKAAKFIEMMVVDEKGHPLFDGIENIIGATLDDDFNLIKDESLTSLPDSVFTAIIGVLNKENDLKDQEGKG